MTLTVDFRITSQPSDVTAAVGENVTFTVRASGTGLTYQWYFKKANDSSFTAWNRKTYASVSTPVYASWNGAKFYCVVTDANGNSVQSETVTLTVDFRITSQPSDVTAAVGDNVTFNVKASGVGLTYQWYFKKANDSSFTAWNRKTYASVSTPVYKSWNGAQFYCVVTDASGMTATSDIVTLTVG